MYEELVKRLRNCADLHGECVLCQFAGNPCDAIPETPLVYAANAIEDMNRQLAADVRPVRFGKLEKYGAAIRCSECGFDTQSWDVNFCPNCGAEMTGGE